MKDSTLTIIIPVKNPKFINEFIEGNTYILNKYRVMVIDSGGGEALRPLSTIYLKKDVDMVTARKIGIDMVSTPFILNLDCDNILPEEYVEKAIALIEGDVKAVAIDYAYPYLLGHLGFGTSLWETAILKKLYSWSKIDSLCECIHMWRRLIGESKLKLETLPYRAIHLKGDKI
jgi:glycosyltransferase involved in cell wall biosynthesis